MRTSHVETDPEPPSWPDLALDAWRRRKAIGLVAFGAVLVGAATTAVSLPDLYRATATVLVERQQLSEAFVKPSVTSALETRIETIHQQVMSRARLTDVIARFDLYPALRAVAPMDALVARVRDDTQLRLKGVEDASGRRGTIAFTLSYTGRDPATVAAVANTLAGFYVEENTKTREQQATRTVQFLQAQVSDAARELHEEEQRVSDFKLRYAGELQPAGVNLTALDRLNDQLRLNSESQTRAMDQRERIEMQLADLQAAPAAGGTADDPETELARLRRQLATLRARFSDRYPDVIGVKAEIAALEKSRAAATGDAVEPAATPAAQGPARLLRRSLEGIDRELASLKRDHASLEARVAEYEARVEGAPERQQQLQQMSGSYEVVNERYQSLTKRLEDAQVAAKMEQGHDTERFRLLDPAIPPARPMAPNRPWILAMGLIAALACGVGAIAAAEKRDTSFHDVEDLSAFTRLPVLAGLRWIPTASAARARRRRVALVAAAAIVGLAVVVAGAYYVAAGNEQITRLTARPGQVTGS